MKKEIYSTISKFYLFKSLDSFALNYHSINDFNHAFTTKFGTISKNTDPFQIPRIDIWNKDSIDDYNLKIEGKYNWYNNIHFLKKLIK